MCTEQLLRRLLATIILLAVPACSMHTPASKAATQAEWQSIPERHKSLILQHQITEGFTMKEVELAWGKTPRKSYWEPEGSGREIWIYSIARSSPWLTGTPDEYVIKDVLFINGKVKSWHEFKRPVLLDYYKIPGLKKWW